MFEAGWLQQNLAAKNETRTQLVGINISRAFVPLTLGQKISIFEENKIFRSKCQVKRKNRKNIII